MAQEKPTNPIEPEENSAAPKAPDRPQEMADQVQNDKAIDNQRNIYKQAVSKMHTELTKLVQSRDNLKEIERKAALDDITSFIGKLSVKVETFDTGQRAKFKVSQKIGDIFKINVGQDYIVSADADSLSPEAKPYKLKFKVKIEPLGVTLGHEQYNKKDEPMALADKSKKFLEIIVYQDGTTGVTLGIARKEDRTKPEAKITDSIYAKVNTDLVYLGAEMSMPAGQGLSDASLRIFAGMDLGDLNAGAFIKLPKISAEQPIQDVGAGISIIGNHDLL